MVLGFLTEGQGVLRVRVPFQLQIWRAGAQEELVEDWDAAHVRGVDS